MKTVEMRCPDCRVTLKAAEIKRNILAAWCEVCQIWRNWTKISPNAGHTAPPAGSGRNVPGQSSAGKAEQKPTPGDKQVRGSANFLRRLQGDGPKGPRPIDDP